MKRVVSSSFITLFIILVIAAAFFYFRNFRVSGGDPVKAIPSDAIFFFSIDASSFKQLDVIGSKHRSVLEKIPEMKTAFSSMKFIDSLRLKNNDFRIFLESSPLYLSAHVTSADKFDFLFLKSIDGKNTLNDLTTIFPQISSNPIERNYDGNRIVELSLADGRVFTYSTLKGVLVGSFTSFLVEDALRQLRVGKDIGSKFRQLRNADTAGINIYLNFKNLPALLAIYSSAQANNSIQSIRYFTNWLVAGIKTSDDFISLNGFVDNNDTLNYTYCIEEQVPVEKKLLAILPVRTAFINYYGLSDFKKYYSCLHKNYADDGEKIRHDKFNNLMMKSYKTDVEQKMLAWMGNEYALVITEPSGTNYENNSYAVFGTANVKKALSSLKSISSIVDKKMSNRTMEESYNGHTIGLVRITGVLQSMFGDAFSRVSKMYYTDIDNYIVFANQASALRNFIDDHQKDRLLVNTEFYKESIKDLPAEGNRYIFCRPSLSLYLLKAVLKPSLKSAIDKYKDVLTEINTVSFQVSHINKVNQVNSVWNFTKNKEEENVSLAFAIEADSSVSTAPLLTTDALSKTRQILFQDDEDNLFMTDNNGNVLWQQQIKGKILGQIHEIDLFKNNSRQFLFNTSEYIYLIDPDGKPVGNYPIRLPAVTTNGLAVFDFDKNKESKIYIACSNNRVYAYLASGKPLPGWNYSQKKGTITDPVRSVTFNGKELLVINDRENGVSLVNRYGESAVTLSHLIIIAQNSAIYSDTSGALITTDPFGSILRIKPDGQVEAIPLNAAGPDHGFLYADADADGEYDYIFCDGRSISAYNKSLALIFKKDFESDITGPIYRVNISEKLTAMAVQSKEADKSWLLKMNGEVFPGFPVKGSGTLIIDELNLDGIKNLLTGSSDYHLYVYRIE
jgi:hypothetical protein